VELEWLKKNRSLSCRKETGRSGYRSFGPWRRGNASSWISHARPFGKYFRFFNEEWPHEVLGYRTPHQVYFGSAATLASAAEAVV